MRVSASAVINGSLLSRPCTVYCTVTQVVGRVGQNAQDPDGQTNEEGVPAGEDALVDLRMADEDISVYSVV